MLIFPQVLFVFENFIFNPVGFQDGIDTRRVTLNRTVVVRIRFFYDPGAEISFQKDIVQTQAQRIVFKVINPLFGK